MRPPLASRNAARGRRPHLRQILCLAALCALFALTACRTAGRPRVFVPEPGADYSRGMMHKVEAGDTLEDIAAYYQRDPGLLSYVNDLVPPNELKPGDYIYVPPDNSDSVIRSGTVTLESIRKVRQEMASADAASSLKPVASTYKGRKNRFLRSTRTVPQAGETYADEPTPPAGDYGFVWPASGTYVRGYTRSGWKKYHLGVDIAAPQGTAIGAAQDGIVIFAGKTRDIPAYGNLVAIDHGNGFTTIYAHCCETLVKPGQRVQKQQTIARVGCTGNATGNHVHLELRYKSRTVDPERYLPARRNVALLGSGQE